MSKPTEHTRVDIRFNPLQRYKRVMIRPLAQPGGGPPADSPLKVWNGTAFVNVG